MEVKFYEIGEVEDYKLEFAVIGAVFGDKQVLVRYKDRATWELPGGHREPGEAIDTAASRELFEETGAGEYKIFPLCDYSIANEGAISYGRVYHCEIAELGELPESEIEEVMLFDVLPHQLTYPDIQTFINREVMSRISAL